MERAGIEVGDYVLLKKKEIRNGDIAAVIYNDETTLKRVYFEEDGLLLVPESEEHEPIRLEPDEAEEVILLGKYIGKANQNGLYIER
jgi:SOS-response transcriptional repressor LexA